MTSAAPPGPPPAWTRASSWHCAKRSAGAQTLRAFASAGRNRDALTPPSSGFPLGSPTCIYGFPGIGSIKVGELAGWGCSGRRHTRWVAGVAVLRCCTATDTRFSPTTDNIPAMRSGFSEDEGWWAVGAHLFLTCVTGLAGTVIGDSISHMLFGRTWLLGFPAFWFGAWLGDLVFNKARRRYLERRQARRQRRMTYDLPDSCSAYGHSVPSQGPPPTAIPSPSTHTVVGTGSAGPASWSARPDERGCRPSRFRAGLALGRRWRDGPSWSPRSPAGGVLKPPWTQSVEASAGQRQGGHMS
jgi:hypothetical protein